MKILIIDTNNILNRAFYAIPSLSTASGQPTNAVYGMVNMLTAQLQAGYDHVVACFDMRAPTFRHQMYTEYKATRKKMSDELASQFPIAREVLAAMGITCVGIEGYEADDLMGTFARIGGENGLHSYIFTGDRDALQLVSDSTTVLLAGSKETVVHTPTTIMEKFSLTPSQLLEVKALMGDSSDNIPGVPGIGEKTALGLIQKYASLDAVYAQLDTLEVTNSVRSKLASGRELADISKKLAAIDTAVPMEVTLDDLAYRGADEVALRELFARLEFNKLLAKIPKSQEAAVDEIKAEILATKVTIDELHVAAKGGEKLFIHLGESELLAYDRKTLFSVDFEDTSELSTLFDIAISLCTYDSKPLLRRLLQANIALPEVQDVMLMAYSLSTIEGEYSIARLANFLPNPSLDAREDDLVLLAELHDYLSERLEQENLTSLYRGVELPLARVLAEMEHYGFAVDVAGLLEFSAELEHSMNAHSAEIFVHAGQEFNINSPKQLAHVLFNVLGLPSYKKTKTGHSTNAEVLEKLRPYHAIVPSILDYRQVAKLRSTYADALPALADSEGIVRTTFRQTGTATGRLSSVEPNLQNIPIRTALGRRMRDYFVPRGTNRALVKADYSQVELRILAHLCKDPSLLEAFANDVDIHRMTAAAVYGVMLDQVTSEQRSAAKAVNFGIIYGMGDFGLATELGITKAQAAEFIRTYLARFPNIEAYMNAAIEFAREHGYVGTIMNRRRYIPEINSKNGNLRAFGERVAKNSPLQGSAADIIKVAMVNVARRLKEEIPTAHLILQVHDELVVDCRAEDIDKVSELLVEEMQSAVTLDVPLVVDVSVGKSWG